jgi:hypothetical protein
MPSSGVLHRVALVRTDVSEERITIIRMTKLGELVTTNVVPSSPILVTLMMETTCSSEISVLTRATRHNNPEDDIVRNDNVFYLSGLYLQNVLFPDFLTSKSLSCVYCCSSYKQI